jgi:hypothetical protein
MSIDGNVGGGCCEGVLGIEKKYIIGRNAYVPVLE